MRPTAKAPGPPPPTAHSLIDRFKMSTLDALKIRAWWGREQHARARSEGGWFAPDGYVAMPVGEGPARCGVPAEVIQALTGGECQEDWLAPQVLPYVFRFCAEPPPPCLLDLLSRLHLQLLFLRVMGAK